jgi:hypothetical protein
MHAANGESSGSRRLAALGSNTAVASAQPRPERGGERIHPAEAPGGSHAGAGTHGMPSQNGASNYDRVVARKQPRNPGELRAAISDEIAQLYRFIDRVETLSARRVIAFMNGVDVGADACAEVFLLAPSD